MNRQTFFAAVRAYPFGGSLSRPQVDGMNAILDEWDRRSLTDLRWLAYMLATTYHETARTMQPIAEYGGKLRRYAPYYGRGFVQLTWEANYRRASTLVGIDLVKNPDRAMEVPIAVKVIFDGMIEGWFTGRKLADYLSATMLTDYFGARHIVNGTDKAAMIAGYAVSFEKALKAAVEPQPQVSDQPVIDPPILPIHPPDDPGVEPSETDQQPTEAAFYIVVGGLGLGIVAIVLKLLNVI